MRLKSALPSLCLALPVFLSTPDVAKAEKPPTSPEAATRKPGVEASGEKAGAVVSFPEQVKPWLARYCVDCHGGAKPKGDLNLAAVNDPSAIARDRKLWKRLAE